MEALAQSYLNEAREVGSLSPSTIRRKRSAFKQYGLWLGEDILVRYKVPRQVPAQPHPVPGGIPTVLKMIEIARRDHQKALIALCGLCGLRVSEAINVTTDNVIFNDGMIQLKVFGKGYKTRTVPISDDAWAAIAPSWAAAKAVPTDPRIVPIGNRVARRTITSIARRIGHTVASHDLRSTFATALYDESDYDVFMVQEALGHSDPGQTKAYTEVDKTRLNTAVNFKKKED